MKRIVPILAAGLPALVLGLVTYGCGGASPSNMTMEELGSRLFHDTSLSSPAGQACSTCHVAANAFTDPRQDHPTSEGVISGRFGSRQTPSISYMAFSPTFHFDENEQDFIGGQFWDGRAATLEEQALQPLLNPSEMNNPSKQAVVDRLRTSDLAPEFRRLFGDAIFNDTEKAFAAIGTAIAAFERMRVFSPFTSKYDYFLRGDVDLTAQEKRGLALFEGKALCANCHPSRSSDPAVPPLFTDFTYDNLGAPKNAHNPFYDQSPTFNPDGPAFIDKGLSSTTKRPDDAGRVKVPTLRNIAITAPYFHNGVFKTLEEVVDFYNERDLGRFAPGEIDGNKNMEELGNLGLTAPEKEDLVAFLKTLTDGYR